MISALIDLLGSLASAFFQVVGALGRVVLELLSALGTVLFWPVRAVWNLLFGGPGLSGPWATHAPAACGLLLLALVAWILWANYRRRRSR